MLFPTTSAGLQRHHRHLAVHGMHPHRVARPTAAQAAIGRDQQLIAAAHFGFPSGDGGCHGCHATAVAGNQLEEHAAGVLGKGRGKEAGMPERSSYLHLYLQ